MTFELNRTYELRRLFEGGSFFECPRWHDDEWYVSDIYGRAVWKVTEAGAATEVLRLTDGRPAGLGWLPDGDLLVVVNNKRQVLRISPDGTETVHADDSGAIPTCGNFNDMVVASDGRAYISSMGAGNHETTRQSEDRPTCITVIDPDGSIRRIDDCLIFPNGMVLTDDERTLVVGETRAHRYTAFDIDASGMPTSPRLWADLSEQALHPDGCCIDAEGGIWVASPRGWPGWMRILEGGEVTDVIEAPPGTSCMACMLGGSDGMTLLLCGRDLPPTGAHASESRDSYLLVTRVDVPHAGAP